MLRAVVRVNKYDGNIHSLLRQNLDRQPMGLAIVAPDANKCKPCYWFGIVQSVLYQTNNKAYIYWHLGLQWQGPLVVCLNSVVTKNGYCRRIC
jgi:hypothetical protein